MQLSSLNRKLRLFARLEQVLARRGHARRLESSPVARLCLGSGSLRLTLFLGHLGISIVEDLLWLLLVDSVELLWAFGVALLSRRAIFGITSFEVHKA